MKKAKLLFIDDLGIEKTSDRYLENLYLIINYRYENKLPTIITSNMSLEDLEKHLTPQITSRIKSMCKIIQFTGKDRRNNLRPKF
jgi:DNA replication protein DnaC